MSAAPSYPVVALPSPLHVASALLDGEILPPQFIIKPFFPRGELVEIVGAHGAFKSTIALDACLSIATGHPWGGHATTKARTAFVTLEDSTHTLACRVAAWLDGFDTYAEIDAARADLRANFSFLAREGSQGLILTRTREGTTTVREDVADHLARLVTGAALVVLETAARLHDGPETNDAFVSFVRALERITTTGATVVIVRHMSKKAAREMRGPDTIDSYAGRGGGALADAVRSCLVVNRHDGGQLAPVTLTAAKTTHAQPGDTVSWAPVLVEKVGAVRLAAQKPEARAQDDAQQLYAYIATCEGGVTRRSLHNAPPRGLTRNRAKQALDYLRSQKRLVMREEQRNGQRTEVFFVPRSWAEVR